MLEERDLADGPEFGTHLGETDGASRESGLQKLLNVTLVDGVCLETITVERVQQSF